MDVYMWASEWVRGERGCGLGAGPWCWPPKRKRKPWAPARPWKRRGGGRCRLSAAVRLNHARPVPLYTSMSPSVDHPVPAASPAPTRAHPCQSHPPIIMVVRETSWEWKTE
eukprot:369617-Rhodomonas_salina.1